MDFSEKWGKDVEDAVKLALHDLKLERDQVDVIVLEEPTKGFFGIGSKLAKVRVQKKEEKIPKVNIDTPDKLNIAKEEPSLTKDDKNKVDAKVVKPTSVKKEKDTLPDIKSENQKDKPKKGKAKKKDTRDLQRGVSIREKPTDLVEMEEAPALDFLKDITNRMGLNVSIKAFSNESCLYFEITGPDSGTVIGKRGQTLDSIQYLTSLVANKNKEKYFRVIVDAENYRSKRERTLEQLANRLGDKVLKTGRSVRLEPMNPYERKVIHATLQRNPAIITRSEGEEPYRRVIIEKK